MDTVLLHPKIVHLPITLAMLMPIITIGLAIAVKRSWLPFRVWVLPILLQGTLLATGVAAMQSGERDEEIAGRVVPEQAIETHEEAAEFFLWVALVGLIFLFGPTLRRRDQHTQPLAFALAAVATIAVLGAGYRVGEAGGELVYVHGAANAYSTAATVEGAFQEPPDHDADSD